YTNRSRMNNHPLLNSCVFDVSSGQSFWLQNRHRLATAYSSCRSKKERFPNAIAEGIRVRRVRRDRVTAARSVFPTRAPLAGSRVAEGHDTRTRERACRDRQPWADLGN